MILPTIKPAKPLGYAAMLANKGYRFFVVGPQDEVLSGGEYREDAAESIQDLPARWRGARILTRRYLVNRYGR